MRVIYDKQNRKYMMLIGLFCLALAVFCLSAGILQGPVVRDSLFEWEKTTASSLLEQGVDASLVAEAFHAKEITPEGERLVEQIGHTQENTSALFPEARRPCAGLPEGFMKCPLWIRSVHYNKA